MNQELSFEEALKRLEEIVSKIESETLSLEESLKLYEEGKSLVSKLEKTLKAAEDKVKEVNKD